MVFHQFTFFHFLATIRSRKVNDAGAYFKIGFIGFGSYIQYTHKYTHYTHHGIILYFSSKLLLCGWLFIDGWEPSMIQ